MYVSALMELFVFCEREINIYPRCDGRIGERLFCHIQLTGETSLRRWHLSWALVDWPQQTGVERISVELELLRGKRERTERERGRERIA